MFRRISVLLALVLFCTSVSANTAIIENSGENRYKAIRLTPEIYNNANSDLSDLRIINADGEYVPYFINGCEQTESIEAVFRTEEKDRRTYIYTEGLGNLRISEIILDTDSMFQRMVEIPVFGIRKELYNLSLNDTVQTDMSIPINKRISADDITLVIYNGDDRPVNINGIRVSYYADELIFEGTGEVYTLRFGADRSVRKPTYDIVRYKDEILRSETVDLLQIQGISIEEIQQEQEPEPYDFKMIFNIVIAVVAVLLGGLILFKLKTRI
jgi:hypothetical protein